MDVRAEVLSLLESHEVASQLMEVDPFTEQVTEGYEIGEFRIVRMLAQGGTALVFEARQDSPKRSVALKVMQHGLTSPEAIRRFRYEAEILGRLQHPGIARILSSGTFVPPHDASAQVQRTPIPYFAMELVESGLPITTYADDQQLTLRQRVRLIAETCEAVQYGHQNGVIHRDLKPSNILIDGQGKSRVIDFGIAQAHGLDAAHSTIQTQTGQVMGTLQYMSPEQFDWRGGAVGTGSDIYSLGVVLYELVCGRPPYEIPRTSIVQAALTVREHPIPHPRSLNPRVSLDLEAILLRSLEKDAAFRYGSVSEFHADLQRLLNRDPVQARSLTWTESFWRFVARRKRAVALASVAILTLLTTAGISLWFGLRASRAESVAQRNVDRLTHAEGILSGLMQDVAAIADSPDGTLQRVLKMTLTELEEDEATDPWVLGLIHLRVADALLVSSYLNGAIVHYGQAIESLKTVPKDDVGHYLDSANVGRAIARASSAVASQDPDEIERALAHLRPFAAQAKERLGSRSQAYGLATAWLGECCAAVGRLEEADKLLEEAFRLAENAPFDDETTITIQRLRIGFLVRSQRVEEAMPIAESLRSNMAPLLKQDHALALVALDQVATCVKEGPTATEAIELLERSFQGWSRRRPATDLNRQHAASRLVVGLLRRDAPGDLERARDLNAELFALEEDAAERGEPRLTQVHVQQAEILKRSGHRAEAVALVRNILESGLPARARYSTADHDPWSTLFNVGSLAVGLGEVQRGMEALELWAAKERPAGWWDLAPRRRLSQLNYAECLCNHGQREKGLELLRSMQAELEARPSTPALLLARLTFAIAMATMNSPTRPDASPELLAEVQGVLRSLIADLRPPLADLDRHLIEASLRDLDPIVRWVGRSLGTPAMESLVEETVELASQLAPGTYEHGYWLSYYGLYLYGEEAYDSSEASLVASVQVLNDVLDHANGGVIPLARKWAWRSHTFLAAIGHKREAYEEAIAWWEGALDVAPQEVLDSPAELRRMTDYGVALFRAGRDEEALLWLEQSQDEWAEQFGDGNPASRRALDLRVKLLKELQRLEEAQDLIDLYADDGS